MKVLHVSATAVAGAPYFWSECFNKYSDGAIESRCFSQIWTYPDGRGFPRDIETDAEAREVMNAADVVLVHNLPPNGLRIPREKTKLIIHSRPNQVHPELLKTVPVAIIAQHQTRFYRELKYSLVPNLIDLAFYSCPKRTGDILEVGYSPSFLKTAPKDDITWDSNKGYEETAKILSAVKGIRRTVLTGVPWKDMIQSARSADVWIDECVTGSYHRSSLQAAAMEQVALNAAGGDALYNMAALTGVTSTPFYFCVLNQLKARLEAMSGNVDTTRRRGLLARMWMERHWNPTTLIENHFLPFLTK